jgi:hypothetical protein
MSTPVQISDLAKLLGALNRRVDRLLKRFDQFVPTAGDLKITEWCAKRRISRAEYYKLRKLGKSPRTIEVEGIIRITAEADREWAETHQIGSSEEDAPTTLAGAVPIRALPAQEDRGRHDR